MKKIIVTFALLLGIISASFSQRCIEYKTTGIKITTDALDQVGCQVRWKVTIPPQYVDTAIVLIPQIQGQLNYKEGKFIYSSISAINSMYAIMDSAKADPSDVGLTGNQLTSNFSLYMLYVVNPLNLSQEFWAIKNE